MPSKPIHVVAYVPVAKSLSFLWLNSVSLCVCGLYVITSFICSSVDGHLGCLHIFLIINSDYFLKYPHQHLFVFFLLIVILTGVR